VEPVEFYVEGRSGGGGYIVVKCFYTRKIKLWKAIISGERPKSETCLIRS
jgi:transcriptional regulator CtsR